MRQTYFGYKKAPDVRATRWEAVSAFVNSSTLAPDATAKLLRDWMGGLDNDDTLAGDNLRAAIAAGSEVVISRAEPPPPPPPPVMVALSLPLAQAVEMEKVTRAACADTVNTTQECRDLLAKAAAAVKAAMP